MGLYNLQSTLVCNQSSGMPFELQPLLRCGLHVHPLLPATLLPLRKLPLLQDTIRQPAGQFDRDAVSITAGCLQPMLPAMEVPMYFERNKLSKFSMHREAASTCRVWRKWAPSTLYLMVAPAASSSATMPVRGSSQSCRGDRRARSVSSCLPNFIVCVV